MPSPNYTEYKKHIFLSAFENANEFLHKIKKELYPESGNKIDCLIYKQGYDAGENLQFKTDELEETIKQRYASYGLLLNQLEKLTCEQNVVEIEANIARVESELTHAIEQSNESKPESKISIIKAKIKALEAKIDDYHRKTNESNFIDAQNLIYYKKLEHDIKELDILLAKKIHLHDLLTKDTSKLKELLETLKFDPLKHDENIKKIENIKEIISHYPFSEQKVDKKIYVNDLLHDELESFNKLIKEKYNNLTYELREGKPFIPPRFHIYLNLIIAFLILTGEVFIVYTFIRKVVGFSTNPPWHQNIFCYGFSLAYPFAIGYLFKYYIANSNNKIEIKRTILKYVIWVVLFSLFLVAIIAASKMGNNYDIDSVNFLFTEIPFDIVARTIFLPTLTILFSVVGSITLNRALLTHKQYRSNYGKTQVIPLKNKWINFILKGYHIDALQAFENEKRDLENEIAQLYSRQRNLEEELAKWKKERETNQTQFNYSPLIDSLQQYALSLFKDGYNAGKAKYLDKKEENYLIYKLLKDYDQ